MLPRGAWLRLAPRYYLAILNCGLAYLLDVSRGRQVYSPGDI